MFASGPGWEEPAHAGGRSPSLWKSPWLSSWERTFFFLPLGRSALCCLRVKGKLVDILTRHLQAGLHPSGHMLGTPTPKSRHLQTDLHPGGHVLRPPPQNVHKDWLDTQHLRQSRQEPCLAPGTQSQVARTESRRQRHYDPRADQGKQKHRAPDLGCGHSPQHRWDCRVTRLKG